MGWLMENRGICSSGFVTHSHSGVISSADGLVEVTDTYHTLTESGARPLLFKGLSIYSLTLDVHEIILSTALIDGDWRQLQS